MCFYFDEEGAAPVSTLLSECLYAFLQYVSIHLVRQRRSVALTYPLPEFCHLNLAVKQC
jgi:hypothetical protein